MKLKAIAIVSLTAVTVSACANSAMGDKQTLGGLLGAAGGAVAGAQFGNGKGQLVGVAAGTLLGALIGSEMGRSLDRADQLTMARTTQDALERTPSNRSARWSNPDSGNSGAITPRPAYTNSNGQYCREFQQTIIVGGEEQSAYGTACRQLDGSWQIVNAADAPQAPQSTAEVSALEPHAAPPRHVPPRARPQRQASPWMWR